MQKAFNPEDIADLFVAYVNTQRLDGLLSLYDEQAVLITDPATGQTAHGLPAIERFYKALLETRPRFERGTQQLTLVNGDIALTSSRLINGAVTAEVARKQSDGSWLWIIDQPVIATEVVSPLIPAL
ncbi:YybH family protein [Niabella beijingensis]|uniref:YybH family protein n=1 Tax=Niabella beijingensis TaxID=2872700 RepID=UPI001CC1361B|nr:nuclear transport factor 2 family protein [Niabella beijingensis]MBZ4188827.1 nuclear transport factor 2 family protein [Niabella beijingensis]